MFITLVYYFFFIFISMFVLFPFSFPCFLFLKILFLCKLFYSYVQFKFSSCIFQVYYMLINFFFPMYALLTCFSYINSIAVTFSIPISMSYLFYFFSYFSRLLFMLCLLMSLSFLFIFIPMSFLSFTFFLCLLYSSVHSIYKFLFYAGRVIRTVSLACCTVYGCVCDK